MFSLNYVYIYIDLFSHAFFFFFFAALSLLTPSYTFFIVWQIDYLYIDHSSMLLFSIVRVHNKYFWFYNILVLTCSLMATREQQWCQMMEWPSEYRT